MVLWFCLTGLKAIIINTYDYDYDQCDVIQDNVRSIITTLKIFD